MADWSDDPEWQKLAESFRADALQKMVGSAVVLQLAPNFDQPGDDFDVKFALELGATVLLGKPLVVVVLPGRTLNPSLRRVATAVVEMEHDVDTEEGERELSTAVKAILENPVDRGEGQERAVFLAVQSLFDGMVSDPDWEGQVSMGFAATFQQHLDEMRRVFESEMVLDSRLLWALVQRELRAQRETQGADMHYIAQLEDQAELLAGMFSE